MTAAEELALVVVDLCEARGVSVRDLVDALERPVLVSPRYVAPPLASNLNPRHRSLTWFAVPVDLAKFTPGLLVRIT